VTKRDKSASAADGDRDLRAHALRSRDHSSTDSAPIRSGRPTARTYTASRAAGPPGTNRPTSCVCDDPSSCVTTTGVRCTFNGATASERRGTPLTDGLPDGLTAAFAEDATKLAQWAGFVRKSRLEAPSLAKVVEVAAGLAEGGFQVARQGR